MRLRVSRFGGPPNERLDLRCLGCDAPVEVHQPDQEYPDRILGTCEQCQGWMIADFSPEGDERVLLFIPGGDFLLKRTP